MFLKIWKIWKKWNNDLRDTLLHKKNKTKIANINSFFNIHQDRIYTHRQAPRAHHQGSATAGINVKRFIYDKISSPPFWIRKHVYILLSVFFCTDLLFEPSTIIDCTRTI